MNVFVERLLIDNNNSNVINNTVTTPQHRTSLLSADQAFVLYVGTIIFAVAAIVGFGLFLTLRRRLTQQISQREYIHGKVYPVCALFVVALWYAACGDFFLTRRDGRQISVSLVLASYFMLINLVDSMTLFMSLNRHECNSVLCPALIGGFVQVSAAFASEQARYTAFFIGTLFFVPSVWWTLKNQHRHAILRQDRYALVMLLLLFALMCVFIWLSMMGHAFGDVFGKADEFGLYIGMYAASIIISVLLATKTRGSMLHESLSLSEHKVPRRGAASSSSSNAASAAASVAQMNGNDSAFDGL
jgi:hypothetical protein